MTLTKRDRVLMPSSREISIDDLDSGAEIWKDDGGHFTEYPVQSPLTQSSLSGQSRLVRSTRLDCWIARLLLSRMCELPVEIELWDGQIIRSSDKAVKFRIYDLRATMGKLSTSQRSPEP